MISTKQKEIEHQIKEIFDEVDQYLEQKYGDDFRLHPNRPEEGETSNPEADGLFNVGVSFTLGLGSEQGRGYVVDLRLSTLSPPSREEKQAMLKDAITQVEQRLEKFLPDNNAKVVQDGNVYKIIGNFSLGQTSR